MRQFPSFTEYCNTSDTGKLLTLYPQAIVSWPLIYRFTIKHALSGTLITPNDDQSHFAQFPDDVSGDTDAGRTYDPDNPISFTVDVALLKSRAESLLTPAQMKTPMFNIEAYYYNPKSEKRLETEQYGTLILSDIIYPSQVILKR